MKRKLMKLIAQVMKKPLQITAVLDKPELLEDLVEKLAERRIDIGYCNATVPVELKAVDTSSTETYVSGTVAIRYKNEIINMPFITCFMFTCMKEKQQQYRLEMAASLS